MSRRSSQTRTQRTMHAALMTIALLGAAACSRNAAPATTPTTSPGDVAPAAAPSVTSSAVAAATSAAMGAAGPLLTSIAAKVPGLSTEQAALATGALLELAKTKMPGEQYAQVATAVPGADTLVSEAKKQGLPASPSSLSAVTEFLGKSGISPAHVSQLATALGGSIGGKVPANVASAFMAALQ